MTIFIDTVFLFFYLLGKELKEKIPLSEKQVDFPLDQIEEQMLNEVRALFSKYRNSLEQAKDMKNNGNWHSTV